MPKAAPRLDKKSLIWLTILSVIVVTTILLVAWLLFRCTCRRKKVIRRHSNGHRHHPSLEVTDGRNQFQAWNKNVTPGDRIGTELSGMSLTPLTKGAYISAARAGELDAHPGTPVVVEEAPLSPVFQRSKASKYYSGVSGKWKRISQIGKAY